MTKNFVQEAMNEVNSLIRSSMEKAMAEGKLPQAELPNYTVEIPGDTSHGDFATNAAMVSARSEERRVGKECRSRWSPYH